MLVDADGSVHPATIPSAWTGSAALGVQLIAQVPGGAAVDPWTGDAERRCWMPTRPAAPGDADAGPGTPDAGLDGGAPSAASDDDGGCDGCATGTRDAPGPAWLVACFLLGLARRRRA